MTDQDLTAASGHAAVLERLARKVWADGEQDRNDREAALAAMRLAIPLRRILDAWIADRARRATAVEDTAVTQEA